LVHEILSTDQIYQKLIAEYQEALARLNLL
jgi:hypothetical protein